MENDQGRTNNPMQKKETNFRVICGYRKENSLDRMDKQLERRMTYSKEALYAEIHLESLRSTLKPEPN